MAHPTSIVLGDDLVRRVDAIIPTVRSLGRHSSVNRSTAIRELIALGLEHFEAKERRRQLRLKLGRGLDALASAFEEQGVSREEFEAWLESPGALESIVEMVTADMEGKTAEPDEMTPMARRARGVMQELGRRARARKGIDPDRLAPFIEAQRTLHPRAKDAEIQERAERAFHKAQKGASK